MTREVRLLRRAAADVDEIYAWLHQRSREGAGAWRLALMARLDELSAGDFLGSPAPEGEKLGVDLRHAFFKTRRVRTYRILFSIVANEVRVLRIRGPGQKPVRRGDVPTDEQ